MSVIPSEDPVRPQLDNKFRTSYGRKIYGVEYQRRNSCGNVFCLHQWKFQRSVHELDKFSHDAFSTKCYEKTRMLEKLL